MANTDMANSSSAGIVRLVISLLLLTTGILKLGHYMPLFFGLTGFNEAGLYVGVGVLEVLLGFWLISFVFSKASWYVAGGFFVCTSLFGVGNLVSGQHACHCFGSHETPVLLSVLVSLASLGCLTFFRQYHRSILPLQFTPTTILVLFGCSVVICGLSMNGRGPSIQSLLSEKVATRPKVDRGYIDYLGSGKCAFAFEVGNPSRDTPISIIGYKVLTCAPKVSIPLPFKIGPGEKRTLPITVSHPEIACGDRGRFIQEYNSGEISVDTCGTNEILVELVTNNFERSNAVVKLYLEPTSECLSQLVAAGAVPRTSKGGY